MRLPRLGVHSGAVTKWFSEQRAVGREGIDLRGLDVGAATAQILPEIVAVYQEDVRLAVAYSVAALTTDHISNRRIHRW